MLKKIISLVVAATFLNLQFAWAIEPAPYSQPVPYEAGVSPEWLAQETRRLQDFMGLPDLKDGVSLTTQDGAKVIYKDGEIAKIEKDGTSLFAVEEDESGDYQYTPLDIGSENDLFANGIVIVRLKDGSVLKYENGKVVEELSSIGVLTVYDYQVDDEGKIVSIQSRSVEVNAEYDADGGLKSASKPDGTKITYANGAVEQVSMPAGLVLHYIKRPLEDGRYEVVLSSVEENGVKKPAQEYIDQSKVRSEELARQLKDAKAMQPKLETEIAKLKNEASLLYKTREGIKTSIWQLSSAVSKAQGELSKLQQQKKAFLKRIGYLITKWKEARSAYSLAAEKRAKAQELYDKKPTRANRRALNKAKSGESKAKRKFESLSSRKDIRSYNQLVGHIEEAAGEITRIDAEKARLSSELILIEDKIIKSLGSVDCKEKELGALPSQIAALETALATTEAEHPEDKLEGYYLSITYGQDGSVVSALDASGNKVLFKDGLPDTVTDKNGNITKYSYGFDGGNLGSMTATRANINFIYDPAGLLSRIDSTQDGEFKIEDGKVTEIKKQDGTTIRDFEYSDGGNLVSGEVALASGEKLIYKEGAVAQSVHSDGSVYAWAISGESTVLSLISQGFSNNSALSIRYDKDGRLSELEKKDGVTLRYSYEYDQNGKVTVTTVDDGQKITRYDAAGNPIVSTILPMDDKARPLTVEYDYARIRKVLSGEVLLYDYSYEFAADGREVVCIEDESTGDIKKYKDSKLVSVLEKDGILTEFEYKDDQVSCMWISINSAPLHRYTFTYEGDKALVEDENCLIRAYDEKDALVYIKYPNGIKYKYEKNDTCQILSLDSENAPADLAKQLWYDLDGDLAKAVRADGSKIIYSQGKIQEMQDKNGDILAKYTYDSQGNIVDITLAQARAELADEIDSVHKNILDQRLVSLDSLSEKAFELRNQIYQSWQDANAPLDAKLRELDEIWRQIGNDEAGAPIKDAQNQVCAMMRTLMEQAVAALNNLSAEVIKNGALVEAQASGAISDLVKDVKVNFEKICHSEIAPIVYNNYRQILGRDPDGVELAEFLKKYLEQSSLKSAELIDKDIREILVRKKEAETQNIDVLLAEQIEALNVLKDSLASNLSSAVGICDSARQEYQSYLKCVMHPGYLAMEIGASCWEDTPPLNQEQFRARLLYAASKMESMAKTQYDLLDKLIKEVSAKKAALEAELPDEIKGYLESAIGSESAFIEQIKLAQDPLELFAAAYEKATGVRPAQEQLDSWLLHQIAPKSSPEDLLVILKNIIYDQVKSQLSPEFKLVLETENALIRWRGEVFNYPYRLREMANSITYPYGERLVPTYGYYKPWDWTNFQMTWNGKQLIDYRGTLPGFGTQDLSYYTNTLNNILRACSNELTRDAEIEKTKISESYEAKNRELSQLGPVILGEIERKKDATLAYVVIYEKIFGAKPDQAQVSAFAKIADEVGSVSAAEVLKKELLSSVEYSEKLAQKQRIIQSVEAYFKGDPRSPPDIDNVLTFLKGQSLHFGSSAFLVLQKLLGPKSPGYEELAAKVIIADILAGNINKDTTGDLLISMHALIETARACGVELYLVKGPASGELTEPYITLINEDHYVAVTGAGKDLKYFDPSVGKAGTDIAVSIEDFASIQKPFILTAQKPTDESALVDERLAHMIRGAWKFKDLFKGWMGVVIGIVFAIALPFLAPIISSIGSVISGALNFIPIIGSALSGMINIATGALSALGSFIGNGLTNLFSGISLFSGTANATTGTAILKTILATGVNYGANLVLDKLGVSPVISNLAGAFLSGGVVGGLTGALQGAAISGINQLGLHYGLDPTLTGLASIAAGAFTGDFVNNLKDGLSSAISSIPQTLKFIAPNVAGELAYFGMSKLGDQLGIDPRISQLAGIPIRASINGVLNGSTVYAILDSAIKGVSGGIASIILDYGFQKANIQPWQGALISRVITSALSGDFFGEASKSLISILTLSGTDGASYSNAVYISKVIDFSNIAREKGLGYALETYISGILQRDSVEFIVSKFASITNAISKSNKKQVIYGGKDAMEYDLSGPDFSKEIKIIGSVDGSAIYAIKDGNIITEGNFGVGPNGKFLLSDGKIIEKNRDGSETITYIKDCAPIKIESAKDGTQQLVINPINGKTSIEFNIDNTIKNATLACRNFRITINEDYCEYENLTTNAAISFKGNDIAGIKLLNPNGQLQKEDINKISALPREKLAEFATFVFGNGFGNSEPEGQVSDIMKSFMDDLIKDGVINEKSAYGVSLFEKGNLYKNSWDWARDAWLGSDVLTNEVIKELDGFFSELTPEQKHNGASYFVHSGQFKPLIEALNKRQDFNVHTIINYEGPYVGKDVIDNPNVKRIINVKGTASVVSVDPLQLIKWNPATMSMYIDPTQVSIDDHFVPLLKNAEFEGKENINFEIIGARHSDFSHISDDPINIATNLFMRKLSEASAGRLDWSEFINYQGIDPVSYDDTKKVWTYRVDPIEFERDLNQ